MSSNHHCLYNRFEKQINTISNLKLLVREILPQFFGHALKVFERDFACFVVIEELKRFQNFFFWIFFSLKKKEKSKPSDMLNVKQKQMG